MGAFAGTAAIIWDVIKWRKESPRLQVTLNPNMQLANPITGELDEEQYIMVRVVNVGRRATKVTHLVGWPFRTRVHRLLGKAFHDFTKGSVGESSRVSFR